MLHFFFACASVVTYVVFALSLFMSHSPSFDALGGMLFVIMTFPG